MQIKNTVRYHYKTTRKREENTKHTEYIERPELSYLLMRMENDPTTLENNFVVAAKTEHIPMPEPCNYTIKYMYTTQICIYSLYSHKF